MTQQNSINSPLPLSISSGGTGQSTQLLANTGYVNYNSGDVIDPMLPFVIYRGFGATSQATFTLPIAPAEGEIYTVIGSTLEIETAAFLIKTTNGIIAYTPTPYTWNTISPVVTAGQAVANGLASISLACIGYTPTDPGVPFFTVLSTNGLPFGGSNT